MSSPAAQPDPSAGDAPAVDASADVDVDIDMGEGATTQQANNTSATANGVASSNPDQDMADAAPQPTSAQQNRKDATLREFMSKMDDYAPIIPDAVTAHYLTLAGLPPPSAADPTGATTNTTPLPLARLLGLATQKFIADIAADAYQYSRIRAGGTSNSLATAAMGGAAGGGAGAAGGGGGAGGASAKGGQNTQLGVQRSGFGGGGAGASKAVLTMEDLGMAVQEYGVNVKRSEFYR